MWAEGGGVGAAVRGECEKGLRAMRRPHAHCAVPAAGAEAVLGDEVPVYAEYFAGMFFPALDGVVIRCAVEELDAAVA